MQQIISTFIIEPIQKKVEFFNKFKKPYFWPIFPIFRVTSIFPKNLPLTLNFIWAPNNIPIPKKCTDRQTDGFKDRWIDGWVNRWKDG